MANTDVGARPGSQIPNLAAEGNLHRKTRALQWRVRGLRGRLLPTLALMFAAIIPAFGELRDGPVDPANLGKGGWILYPLSNPDATFSAMKSQGFNFVIVKAGTSNMLWTGSWKVYVPPSNPAGAVFTSALVQKAHAHGLLIFGSNRSGGDASVSTIDLTEINGEIQVADYVFNQGADGFIWDAESTWESSNPGLGNNGPALAWLLCSTVRSHWPTKFLALNPQDTIYLHSSLPYKEFAYWADCIMPMVYHHAESQGNAFAAIHWMDANYGAWQDSLYKLPSTNINGLTVYWTNAIKPLVPMRDVYADANHPDADVLNFLDYLVADPNCVTVGGYRGFVGYRSELYSPGQLANIQASTIGSSPGVVNNIVIDDANASVLGPWTMVRTMNATTNTAPIERVIFYGVAGTDTNSFGTNYCSKGPGDGSAYVRFTPNIIAPGDYNLYEWHPDRVDASTNVPHIITCNGGSTNVYVDQTINAGNWNFLGKFNFAAGTNGNITITDGIPESGAVAMADGLKLVFVAPNPPHIDAIDLLSTGQIRLQLSGCPGQYGIDGALTLTNWSEVANFITSTNRFEYVDQQTNLTRRFYRARLIW